jgi:plastocyanin
MSLASLLGVYFYLPVRERRRDQITIWNHDLADALLVQGDDLMIRLDPNLRMGGMGSTRPPGGLATRLQVGAACLLLAVVAALLGGCGSNAGGTDQSSSGLSETQGTRTVTIQDYTYKPTSITVPKGTSVIFTNRDSTPHTATSKESGVFESSSIDTGKTGKITLEKTGTFAYYCVFHPFMKGTIVVE